MKKITLLIPAYNEEEVLEMFYNEVITIINSCNNYKFELLFINDGSTDNTLEIIRKFQINDNRVSYLDLSRNYGKEIAMAAGIDKVNSDAMIIMDADLQDPPELIKEMSIGFEEGYDDVYAKRISRDGETILKKLTSKIFYKVLDGISRVPIQKDTGDFRLLSKKAVESMKKFDESQRYTKGLFSLIGHRKKEILFERKPRAAGNTKWNYLKLTELAIEGITSFTTAPLKLATYVGFIISLLSLIYITVIVVKTLVFGITTPGYASLMCVILLMGGLQFIFIGVIGEYLGRVFLETKKRPLYFINEFSRVNDNEE